MASGKQSKKRLAKNLRRKFVQETVIIIGNWTADNGKQYETIKGVRVRRMLRKEGLKIYLLNEHKTSSLCSFCKDGTKLEKFKKVPRGLRSFHKEVSYIVAYHGSRR